MLCTAILAAVVVIHPEPEQLSPDTTDDSSEWSLRSEPELQRVELPDPVEKRAPEDVPAAPGGAAPAPAVRDLIVHTTPGCRALFGNQLLAELQERHPGLLVRVVQDNSNRNCIERVVLDRNSVAFVSARLSKRERKIGLSEQALGYRIVVPIVHVEHPVHSLMPQDMRRLLDGAYENWRQLGGGDAPIFMRCLRPVPRLDRTGEMLRFRARGLGVARFAETEREILAAVSREPNTIGLVTLRSLRKAKGVRALLTQFIEPNARNVERGAYKMATHYGVVFSERRGPAKLLLDFLANKAAATILNQTLTR